MFPMSGLCTHCKNEENRSKLCRRCGGEGLIAKDRDTTPSCKFCRKKQTKDASHIAGSNKCPVFRRALNTMKYDMKVIQINLNSCEAAQDLVAQIVVSKRAD